MTFNFNWKINLAFARKYRFLWIEKPLITFLGSVFYQTLIVGSSYFIFYISFSILLKEELMLSDTFILILFTLLTIYLIISILNMNILYKVSLPNTDWEKIRNALKDMGIESVFFIEKDNCLVGYSNYAFKFGRQIVVIKTTDGFLVNQKISDNYNVIYPIAPFATWRLKRKLEKAANSLGPKSNKTENSDLNNSVNS